MTNVRVVFQRDDDEIFENHSNNASGKCYKNVSRECASLMTTCNREKLLKGSKLPYSGS